MNETKKIASPIAGCMRWGKWGANFDTYSYRQIIDACLQNDIVSFDHADIYGDYTTEKEFGNALKENASIRNKIKIITKSGIQLLSENRLQHSIKSYNTSAKHIITSVEQSLKNFSTDYLDIFLIHRPDILLHPAEIAEAINLLKQQGKIIQFGVSNFAPHQIDMLNKFISIEYNQTEISIIHLQPFTNGTLDKCLQHNIIPMAWAALGGGLFVDDSHPRFRSIYNVAHELAEKYVTGINQILIAFLLLHPSQIVPIVGTTKIERLLQAKEASTIHLQREDWYKLWVASTGEDVE